MGIKSWLGKVNRKRLDWGILYFVVGLSLLVLMSYSPVMISWAYSNRLLLSWVVGWSAIGIGLGLINSRENGGKEKGGVENEHLHYLLYFGFALFVSSLASFAFSRNMNGLNYLQSALIALTLGFAAERIRDLTSMGG